MAEPVVTALDLDAHLESLHAASFGWARSCCAGDADEAADVLQATYEKVLGGRATFAGRSSFRTWLFGVIRLTALESHRRGARELRVSDWDGSSTPQQADAALLEAEREDALRHALQQLPARQREVLHLVFYEGVSVTQAAEMMDLSVALRSRQEAHAQSADECVSRTRPGNRGIGTMSNESEFDRTLREQFEALRERDADALPAFGAMRERAPAKQPRRAAGRARGCLAGARRSSLPPRPSRCS